MMHPDIKAFFERNGRIIYSSETHFYLQVDAPYTIVADDLLGRIIYIFNRKQYSEVEMLKIIKMKVFL